MWTKIVTERMKKYDLILIDWVLVGDLSLCGDTLCTLTKPHSRRSGTKFESGYVAPSFLLAYEDLQKGRYYKYSTYYFCFPNPFISSVGPK